MKIWKTNKTMEHSHHNYDQQNRYNIRWVLNELDMKKEKMIENIMEHYQQKIVTKMGNKGECCERIPDTLARYHLLKIKDPM
jgi:hypothetical protein